MAAEPVWDGFEGGRQKNAMGSGSEDDFKRINIIHRGWHMEIPVNLLENVNDGNVVLVLGAGASIGASRTDGSSAPTSTALAKLIADKFLGGEHETDPLQIVAELAISESSLPQVQEFIRDVFQDINPSAFHLLIPTFKWAALATTNFDLVIERAYSTCTSRTQELVPMIQNGDQIDNKLKSATSLRLLKLHGCITRTYDQSVPLILSIDQYVTHKYGRDRLFGQLKDLSYEHILVFVGHSLQDPDIRQLLLEMGEPDKRPRYYTVTPHLTAPQKRLWESKRITPLEGSFEEFLSTLDREVGSVFRGVVPEPSTVDLAVSDRFIVHNPGLSPGCFAFLENDVEYVRANMPTEALDPKLFYRGYSPRWSAVTQALDVKRNMQDNILAEAILSREEESRCRFYLLKGHAGSGKSVLLQRIAWEAATQYNSLCLFLRSDGNLTFDALQELSRVIDERIYLFVDDVGDNMVQVLEFIKSVRRSQFPVTIVAAEANKRMEYVL